MSNVDKAMESQVKNLQVRTGKTLQELFAILHKSGLSKHGELRDTLKKQLGMGHGDANTVVHLFRSQDSASESNQEADPLEDIYTAKKAHLRPIHDKLMAAIEKFGTFEVAPKKAYVSLRRKKQFATIGPATQARVEVGLNARGLEPTDRLQALPPGKMCQYKVDISDPKEVDKELIGWIKAAFEAAG